MRNIHKSFPGVRALKGVDFHLNKGEIHALMGENGAGKSTLIKVLTGVYSKDEGQIFIDGSKTPLKDVTTKEFMQGSFGPYTVPDNCYFVMGDNRASSADSRYHQDDGDHGLVPIDNVVGVGLMRYWPLNRMSFLSSHHDVFKDVPAGKAQ